ncbi:FliO/MopB family protein [Kineococcus rhizosphaerae]|uniref:Flagellar protein FliO/FliZ n=1 Tax=Kineococcus rhizosphaerae TaxID=559628 RepID=A0A2T0RAL8_9ACTN|nr:flagellar biosynthetic protein FliO [Kineococcus rhizosphaerae]PRY18203.1 flagellar protein FliO/FliZ [Kineococcus rhizosphaerae]
MDAVAAIARTSISLVAVLGLLYLISRWLRRRQGGTAAGADFAVLAKQSLGAKAAVALVKVGDRALVVGVSDAGVNLLGETDVEAVFKDSAERVEEVDITATDSAEEQTTGTDAGAAQPQTGERYLRKAGETIAVKAPAKHTATGVNGSALNPATWSKAVDVLRERTTRR